ncbi:MFS transporter [Comamonadaceae bacterium G21597-S1]|nr:MFS transporter [Comamonadaceae bacterium G21597-S1]
MGKLLIPLAALLSGVGLLIVGTGLMFAAIGAQASTANFSSLVTGLVMSAYFAGAIYGTYACPHIIRKVGFIRAFAAMASVASTLPLLHALWINPVFWGALRFITGLCLVGLYLVVESWLNVVAPTDKRGKVFAIYLVVNMVALAVGQWLILVGDRNGFVPFVLVSVLFSFALLPITLTPVEQPEITEAPKFSLIELFTISPIGTLGALVSGMLSGPLLGLGHVFGAGVGFSDAGIATFMAATILGGAAFQWPVGHFSDRHDRRLVLFWVAVACAGVAAVGFLLARDYENSLIALGVVFGGLAFTVYGISVAHVNDLVDRVKVLQVTGGLLLLNGMGATIGPTLAGGMMDLIGPEALMLYFSVVLAALAALTWHYRRKFPMNRGEPSEKADFVMAGASTQAVLPMDPRFPDSEMPAHDAAAGETAPPPPPEEEPPRPPPEEPIPPPTVPPGPAA